MKTNKAVSILSVAILGLSLLAATAANADAKKVDVNLSNIRTVETHQQFANYQKIAGGINKWQHVRQPVRKSSCDAECRGHRRQASPGRLHLGWP